MKVSPYRWLRFCAVTLVVNATYSAHGKKALQLFRVCANTSNFNSRGALLWTRAAIDVMRVKPPLFVCLWSPNPFSSLSCIREQMSGSMASVGNP
jgi:hypothetical protein